MLLKQFLVFANNCNAQSVGEVSAYQSCEQFSGYVEMKVTQDPVSERPFSANPGLKLCSVFTF